MDLSLVDVLRPDGSSAATATLHPLVRDASRLDAGDQASTYLDLAADLLHEVAAPDPVVAGSENPVNWPAWQLITPHTFAVLAELVRRPETAAGTVEKAALAAIEAGRFLRARGVYAAAGDELRMVAQVCAERLGPEERTTLAARHHLGRELARAAYAADDLAAAESDLRDVRRIRAEVLGHEHPQTLATGHDLALVLASGGRLAEAHHELVVVWEARTRVLGAEHPDTRRSSDELIRLATPPGA